MNLPSGTVTFLFTDIEGSTRLWDEHPEAMCLALARHDAVMRQAIENNEGVVFKTVGDAFCAVFATAPNALAAALAAQLTLINAEAAPDRLALHVRMALHTGTAELRDSDYFGQPLNRVARLLAAGYGNQVLLSAATQELIRDALAPSTHLQALGEHRLRDLSRPETVYQLLHPDLPAEFPPLKSLDNPALPNNLPCQLTSFIGRESEMPEVRNLLEKTRLLTLTGSGGCGKTRLALQVAADMLEQFRDGVWMVELAPLADPDLVPQSVASVLNLSEQVGKSYTQILTERLKSRRLLLVLDNCEHLLSACTALSDALLRSCPHVKILASSREGLGMAGEQIYRVPSLNLPDRKQKLTASQMSQYEGVRLFIERAISRKADFVVTDENARALASVCHRLDGIPLAIELAAARVRSLSVEEIDTRLDNRFRLLTGGSKTALPRQQTLRALIDWSYGLLTDQEKLLLCRLSVFVGGWTLAAAEQVCAGASDAGEGIEDWEALDLLTSLVDKSLVIAEAREQTTRYGLLETVRQYARDRLAEGEASLDVLARHRDYFLALGESIKPKLHSAEQIHWLAVLEEEHDNLRQALTFCLEEPEGAESGLRLGAALQQFWSIRGHLSEGRQHLSGVLSLPMGQGHLKARADALNGAGALAHYQGDYAAARALYEQSLTIRRELGDKQGIARSVGNLGIVANFQGDYAAAQVLHQENLAIARALGDEQSTANGLMNLGIVVLDQGDNPAARARFEESLSIFRELGDTRGIANSLGNLGIVANCQGDNEAARSMFEESLAIFRESGDRRGIANTLDSLGELALRQGNNAAARARYEESLTIRRELGDKRGIAGSLDACASLNNKERLVARAARLWGAASLLREAIGLPRPPNVQEVHDNEIADARAALGETAFEATFAEGRGMTWEQAVVFVLEDSQ